MKRKLGIIGGMGPLATALFMELIIEMTEAAKDSDHINMDIINMPGIPDRTEYILGRSAQNPVPEILRVKKELEERGAQILAMPCNTAFYFYEELSRNGLPMIHAIEETAVCLKEAGVRCAGILATDGTIQTELFQKGLERLGIVTVIPDEYHQKLVMSMIYEDVKAGKTIPEDKIRAVEKHLQDKGAEILVLGCTELSQAKRNGLVGAGYLDTLEVMARKAVLECGVLKKKYQSLL
ncbi:MAG: amino acid racemase [Lachnospiraceae bacterium]|nr:amino acid racemase [Lachnospiraceae bacterium]